MKIDRIVNQYAIGVRVDGELIDFHMSREDMLKKPPEWWLKFFRANITLREDLLKMCDDNLMPMRWGSRDIIIESLEQFKKAQVELERYIKEDKVDVRHLLT